VKEHLASAATSVLAEINSRFPSNEALDAHALVYPDAWGESGGPVDEDDSHLVRRMEKLISLYCVDVIMTPTDRAQWTAKAPINEDKLRRQLGSFVAAANVQAGHLGPKPVVVLEEDMVIDAGDEDGDLEDAAGEKRKRPERPKVARTTRFWLALDGGGGAQADSISEWIKLAQLALVQVHGSIEDERMFSAMAYLKSKHRNRLQESHLNVAARFFNQTMFTMETFPYQDALDLWHAAAPTRGRYNKS
jgi:hypothetical protein